MTTKMKKTLLLPATAMLLSLGTTVQADNKQVVTINGQTVDKTAQKLTFDRNNVVLHFTDGQTMTVDMADVVITLTEVDALKAVNNDKENAPLLYFDLNGRQLGQAPEKGAYIIKKGTKVVKLMK